MDDDILIRLLSNPMQGVRIKIDRAKKHFDELDREIHAFWRRHPYQVWPYCTLEPREVVHALRIQEDIPVHWAGMVGDIVHNLRCALDHLAYALVACGGGNPGAHTTWPVAPTRKDFLKSGIPSGLKGAKKEALKLAQDTPSYAGGPFTIWNLNQLDVEDKHHALVPASCTIIQDRVPGVPIHHTHQPNPNLLGLPDGLQLLTHSIYEWHVFCQWEFIFGVAFGKGQVLSGYLLMPTLENFFKVVIGTSTAFAHEIFHDDEWLTRPPAICPFG